MKMGQYISMKRWHHPTEGNVNPEDGDKIFLTSIGPQLQYLFQLILQQSTHHLLLYNLT
jgi:hypothetical protein